MDQVTNTDIPNKATDIVMFVHGFGVRWDSRGMFTDIRDSLPNGWGSVLFDLYRTDGEDVYITNIDEQVSRLQDRLATVKNDHPDAAIHIIAHSMGCIVASLAKPQVSGKVIFLSPPENFNNRIEDYFKSQPGTKVTNTELIVPRKDDTLSHIPLDFFDNLRAVDPEMAILDYSRVTDINLLQTTEDEVIGQTEYRQLQNNPRIKIKSVPSDHNFTGEHRQELLHFIDTKFEKVYVVDQNDEILGEKYRDDLTDTDCWRLVAIWVENSAGEILIQQRAFTKELNPGQWTAGALGTVTLGSSYEETARRELKEELGVTSTKLEYVTSHHYKASKGFRNMQTFKCVVDMQAEQFIIQKEEVEQVAWISPEELRKELAKNPQNFTIPDMWGEAYGFK